MTLQEALGALENVRCHQLCTEWYARSCAYMPPPSLSDFGRLHAAGDSADESGAYETALLFRGQEADGWSGSHSKDPLTFPHCQ